MQSPSHPYDCMNVFWSCMPNWYLWLQTEMLSNSLYPDVTCRMSRAPPATQTMVRKKRRRSVTERQKPQPKLTYSLQQQYKSMACGFPAQALRHQRHTYRNGLLRLFRRLGTPFWKASQPGRRSHQSHHPQTLSHLHHTHHLLPQMSVEHYKNSNPT